MRNVVFESMTNEFNGKIDPGGFAGRGNMGNAQGPGKQARMLERKYDAQFKVVFDAIR